MGRTSKFSFPYPGRKPTSKETKPLAEVVVVPSRNTSKAQKLLGTAGDLNIDVPNRDDRGSWRLVRRASSSAMSIAISESTQDDLSSVSHRGNWDGESSGHLEGKPSSTLLGLRYQDEVSTDTSSLRRKLHTEHSSSTLRSYYDRQNSPLSVSQQTSASSARDLALRKGFPPVTSYSRSPLLQMDSMQMGDSSYLESPLPPKSPNSQFSKKKPARLDLTRLFPKPRKDGGALLGKEYLTRSPSIMSQESFDTRHSGRDSRRKLTKSDSKTKKPHKPAAQHEQSKSSPPRKSRRDRLSNVYEDQEKLPYSSTARRETLDSTDSRISYDNYPLESARTFDYEMSVSPAAEDEITWRNIKASLPSPPWEARSFTSNSSRNTKGSRHTSASTMSTSDLRNNSVLSISSDEDSDKETNVSESQSTQYNFKNPFEQPTKKPSRSSLIPQDRPATGSSTKTSIPMTMPGSQDGKFLTIPLPPLAGSRLSGPWNPRRSSKNRQSSSPRRRDSASVASSDSSPPSPAIVPQVTEFQPVHGRNSRLMAVTKQEEALLEALRQKRARMKENIIAEHETKRPTPHTGANRHVARDSDSSVLTLRASGRTDTQRVLLYFDKPLSFDRDIDTAEPSPDLSDFLSFGSDEDDGSTPRTSWIMAKDRARADSVTSPESECRDSPKTPQSAARLSAVGGMETLGREPRVDERKGVSFLEGVKGSAPDYLEDVDEAWGM